MNQNITKEYHIHISAKHNWYNLNLADVWKYKDLIILFTKRNFLLTFKQTILGPIWIFLNPFITSIIYTVVFGKIAGIHTEGVPQILYYLCSNALWGYFAECVNKNSATFVSNSSLFGKVYFPRATVPISNALSSLVRFGIQILLLGGFFIYYIVTGEVRPNWAMWPLIPVILLELGALGIGVGILISSLTTKYRDLFILVSFGISLWMYATPIIYPLSQVEDGIMRIVLLINPVTAPVELFRYAMLGQGTVLPGYLIWSLIFTILVVFFGIILFNYVEKTFMDTV